MLFYTRALTENTSLKYLYFTQIKDDMDVIYIKAYNILLLKLE